MKIAVGFQSVSVDVDFSAEFVAEISEELLVTASRLGVEMNETPRKRMSKRGGIPIVVYFRVALTATCRRIISQPFCNFFVDPTSDSKSRGKVSQSRVDAECRVEVEIG